MDRRWVWVGVAASAMALLCVFVAAAGLAYFQAAPALQAARTTPVPTATVRPQVPATPTQPAERLEFPGRPLVIRPSGGLQVSGLAKNAESRPRSAVLLATFYNDRNVPVGTAIGSVQNVQPNDSKPYTLYSTETITAYARIEVKVQTRLPANDQAESVITFAQANAAAASGGFQVTARATNADTKPHKFTAVATLLDASDNVVGIARGAVPLVAPGANAQVTLVGSDRLPQFAKIRVQVDLLEE